MIVGFEMLASIRGSKLKAFIFNRILENPVSSRIRYCNCVFLLWQYAQTHRTTYSGSNTIQVYNFLVFIVQ